MLHEQADNSFFLSFFFFLSRSLLSIISFVCVCVILICFEPLLFHAICLMNQNKELPLQINSQQSGQNESQQKQSVNTCHMPPSQQLTSIFSLFFFAQILWQSCCWRTKHIEFFIFSDFTSIDDFAVSLYCYLNLNNFNQFLFALQEITNFSFNICGIWGFLSIYELKTTDCILCVLKE